jgi:hypothetical protein
VRAALADACTRFETLITGINPQAMATAEWTVTDTAAHVTGIAWLYTTMVVSDDTPLPIPGMRDAILATTVDNIHGGVNAQLLRGYPEREPRVIAARRRAGRGDAGR